MSAELSLTWDDHPKTLLGVFEKLLETSSLVDCTIAAEGQYLKAHKIILSACSPYFQLLFSQENEKNPIVVLKDIKFQELKAMIDFMYRGKVNVSEERLGDFVDAAESLQIKGLGSGNSQKTSSIDTGNGDPDIQKRWSQASPLPHKRQIRTDFQDGLRRPVHVVNFESKTSEEQSNEICVEAPNLCRDETRLPVSSAINSPLSLHSDVSSEMKNFDLTKSVSFEKLSLLPCEEAHPNPDSVVVKSELEDVTEVDIQEPDFYIEAKEEELEATGGETNSEIAISQIPGAVGPFPTSSAAQGSDLPAPSITASCTGPEGLADGRGNFLGRGALEDQAALDPSNCSTLSPHVKSSRLLPSSVGKRKHRPPHSCLECGKVFSSISVLRYHRRVHTGERPYSCNICERSFASKGNLQTHLRVHTRERPFRCELCGKSFSKGNNLRQHITVHTGERPYSCEVCGKSFALKCSLQLHMRTHTGERPHSCDLCGKTFSQGGNLRKHMTVHSGERPYSCEVCEKSFSQGSNLRTHMTVHSGERPYSCEVCGKSFSQRCNLRTHVGLHSGERRYNCGECGKTFGRKIRLENHLKKCVQQSSIP